MRHISSESKLANVSSLIHQNIHISNSERILKETEDSSFRCHHSIKHIPTANHTSEYKSMTKLKEEKQFGEKIDVQPNQILAAPDGGWGWVICAACFMGE